MARYGNVYKKKPRGTSGLSPSVKQTVKMMAEGDYTRSTGSSTGNTMNLATEVEVMNVENTASTDLLCPWIRFRLWQWSVGGRLGYMLYVIKKASADALPNLDDATVFESEKQKGNIFHAGLYLSPYEGESLPKFHELEYRNVKLKPNWKLAVVTAAVTALNPVDVKRIYQIESTRVWA